jgi:hypothetical protein
MNGGARSNELICDVGLVGNSLIAKDQRTGITRSNYKNTIVFPKDTRYILNRLGQSSEPVSACWFANWPHFQNRNLNNLAHLFDIREKCTKVQSFPFLLM